MTVLSMAIPLLADAVVVAVVVTPLCGGSREQQVRESEEEAGSSWENVAVSPHSFAEWSNTTVIVCSQCSTYEASTKLNFRHTFTLIR